MSKILLLPIQSINYMGSKAKLLPFLFSHIPYSNELTFFDGFSGSLRVGGACKHLYKSVTACDKQEYSSLLGKVLLKTEKLNKKIILDINNLKEDEGYFSKYFGGEIGDNLSSIQQDGNTRLFTIQNARKIQAARNFIETLTGFDKSYALYCLIIAAAKVQSSVGHQNGYLKTFSKNSLKKIDIQPINIDIVGNEKNNNVLQGDIFQYIQEYRDVFYFDPPYGTSNYNVPVATRYSAFYHFWNTLILNDEPEIFGKANRRIDSKAHTDPFEINKKITFLPLIKKLFLEANGKHIFLSLSNQSVISCEELLEYCNLDIQVYQISHAENVQGKKTKTFGHFSIEKPKLIEYLFYFKK